MPMIARQQIFTTFTNQDGRTLKGTIVSVTGDTVSLKRENGDAVT